MKAKTSIFAAFVVGAALASLPYTLSTGKTVAQGAGPSQGQGFPPRQGGQGLTGQGDPQGFGNQGQQGQFRQGGQMPMGGPVVNSMVTSGNYLFASAGDTIYKINIDTMQILGQTKLPQPRPQLRGNGRPGQQPGGNGSPPPSK